MKPKQFNSQEATVSEVKSSTRRYKKHTPIDLSHQEFLDFVKSYQLLPLAEQLQLVDAGVSKKFLETVKYGFGIQYKDLADILHVTDRTLHLKKGKDLFSSYIADRIFAIIDVYSLGYEVFKLPEPFHSWMTTKNRMLGSIPLDLLRYHSGIATVKDELKRIAYGIL